MNMNYDSAAAIGRNRQKRMSFRRNLNADVGRLVLFNPTQHGLST